MSDAVFRTASDATLIRMITGARRRLVLAAPAVSTEVARALVARFADAGELAVTIILDADPEVYRLGYGAPEGLTTVRTAAAEWMIDLRVQHGLRIGMLAADDATLVFAPTPLLVEAGAPRFDERPNAVLIDGAGAARIAEAATGGEGTSEIGRGALTTSMAEAVEADLKADPPKPFDLARAVRVFSSKAKYVELSIENCRFSSRNLKLPQDLLDVTDDALKSRITARMKLHDGKLPPVKMAFVKDDGSTVEREVGEDWIKTERTRIENDYTFVVPHHGRIILHKEQARFAAEVKRFETNVRSYRDALVASLVDTKAKLIDTIVREYVPRWMERPPRRLSRFGAVTEEEIRRELEALAAQAVEVTVGFSEPTTKVVYKDITAESVADPEFKNLLYKAFKQKGASASFVDGLFGSFDAAPEVSRPSIRMPA